MILGLAKTSAIAYNACQVQHVRVRKRRFMNTGVPSLTPTYSGLPAAPDGKVRGDVWQRAEIASGFHVVGSTDLAARETRVRACYDRLGLHFLFECLILDPQGAVTNYGDDSPELAEDDSVSVIISPYSAAGPSMRHHFIVNAAGSKLYTRPDIAQENENWRAAAVVLPDRWIANIFIPFQILRPLGRNEDCWRINFRRHDVSSGERSCWSPVPERFESCERMGRLLQPDTPVRFIQFRGPPLPIKSSAKAHTGLVPVTGSFPELWPNVLVPEPQETRRRISKTPFKITPDTVIVVNADMDDVSLHAAREINTCIERHGNKALNIVSGAHVSGSNNLIVIGESINNPLLKSICEAEEIRMPRSRYRAGAHVIDVLPGRVVVAGTSGADTFNGVQTLKQLITQQADGSLAIMSIAMRDYPQFAFRAVHVQAGRDAGSFVPKLLDLLIAPLKFNYMLLQFRRSDWEHLSLIKQIMPDIIKAARARHVAVIPVIDFGAAADSIGVETIDRAIELFDQPPYVHVGNCVINEVHEHIHSCECRAMVWRDTVDEETEAGIDSTLLHDAVICERCAQPSLNYPRLAQLPRIRLSVVGCPSCDPRSIFMAAEQIARFGGSGIVQSIVTGHATEQEALENNAVQLWSSVLASAWSWNPSRPNAAEVNYRPRAVFERLWSGCKGFAGKKFAVVDLDPYFNISRADSGRTIGWLGLGRGNDLREVPTGVTGVGGVPFKFGPSATNAPGALLLGGKNAASRFPREARGLRVGSLVSAFHIVQACAYGADVGTRVSIVAVRYADGETHEIPFIYGQNTYAWDDKAPAMAYCFAWRHCAQDGRMIGVCHTVWNNPRPETAIESLDFISESTQACPFLLAITAELP